MRKPRIDAPVADEPPLSDTLTPYDELHLIHYIILLDADRDGIPWQDAAREALHLDPEVEPGRAWRAYETHLARAKWMTQVGYRHLLTTGPYRDQLGVPRL